MGHGPTPRGAAMRRRQDGGSPVCARALRGRADSGGMASARKFRGSHLQTLLINWAQSLDFTRVAGDFQDGR